MCVLVLYFAYNSFLVVLMVYSVEETFVHILHPSSQPWSVGSITVVSVHYSFDETSVLDEINSHQFFARHVNLFPPAQILLMSNSLCIH